MQAGGVVDGALVRIAGHEAAGERVVPAGAQVVEAEVGVVTLAAVEVDVGRADREPGRSPSFSNRGKHCAEQQINADTRLSGTNAVRVSDQR